jgi:cyclase
MHPYIDRPGGGSVRNWMKSLDTIAKEMPSDVIYIAGHAKTGVPVTADRGALLKQRDYFDAVLTHVTQGIARHASRDEITSLTSLPGFEDLQSSPPRFTLAFALGVAYDELIEK